MSFLRSQTTPKKPKVYTFRRPKLSAMSWIIALLWLLVALVPYIFMVGFGFKSQTELYSSPVYKLPKKWDPANFALVVKGSYFHALLNSVLVVVISMIIVVLVSSSASFAFARLRFKGNAIIFSAVVAGLIVPQHTTLIPIYILTNKLHVYDSLAALIGPYVAFSIPITIFILTQFMREIPKDFFEAAIVDGASHARVFFKVYLPLARTALVTVVIFNAVALWNEFLFAYVLTSSSNKRTLPLTIFDYQGEYTSNTPAIMAALTLAAVPLFLAYFVFQEKLVNGVMAGAIKS
jgi:raffinose/stachyose/melibiose transport system permease protein